MLEKIVAAGVKSSEGDRARQESDSTDGQRNHQPLSPASNTLAFAVHRHVAKCAIGPTRNLAKWRPYDPYSIRRRPVGVLALMRARMVRIRFVYHSTPEESAKCP